jgi:hypothetical protein
MTSTTMTPFVQRSELGPDNDVGQRTLTTSEEFVPSDPWFYPFLHTHPELDFSGLTIKRSRVSVYNVGSAGMRKP